MTCLVVNDASLCQIIPKKEANFLGKDQRFSASDVLTYNPWTALTNDCIGIIPRHKMTTLVYEITAVSRTALRKCNCVKSSEYIPDRHYEDVGLVQLSDSDHPTFGRNLVLSRVSNCLPHPRSDLNHFPATPWSNNNSFNCCCRPGVR